MLPVLLKTCLTVGYMSNVCFRWIPFSFQQKNHLNRFKMNSVCLNQSFHALYKHKFWGKEKWNSYILSESHFIPFPSPPPLIMQKKQRGRPFMCIFLMRGLRMTKKLKWWISQQLKHSGTVVCKFIAVVSSLKKHFIRNKFIAVTDSVPSTTCLSLYFFNNSS